MISKSKVAIRICVIADILLFGISAFIGFWFGNWIAALTIAVFGISIFNLTVWNRAKNGDKSLNVFFEKFEKWLNNNGSR
jgi:hypothetical protein